MYEDAVALPAPGRGGDDHLDHPRAGQESPEGCGREMTEHGAIAQRQHAGGPARLTRARHVPDRVDAGMARDEPAKRAPLLDLAPGEADRTHLRARHVAVLARRKLRDATSVASCSHGEH